MAVIELVDNPLPPLRPPVVHASSRQLRNDVKTQTKSLP